MDRDEIFEQDRGETYASATNEEDIRLPLTRKGFEALFTEVTSRFLLPQDDLSRMVLAGYVHHIPNEQDTTTIGTLGKVLRKSIANSMTWKIDQEIKAKRREEDLKKSAEVKKEESTLSVVGSDEPATQGA